MSTTTLSEFHVDKVKAPARDWLGLLLLVLFLIQTCASFTPQATVENAATGSSTRQLEWIGLFLLSVYVLYRHADETGYILRKGWPLLLPLSWCAISFLWSDHPDIALRRAILLLIGATIAMAIAVTRPRPADVMRVLALVLGCIVGADLVLAYAAPGFARAEGGEVFVGLHSHKNGSGKVAALALICWAALVLHSRSIGWRIIFLCGSVAWAFFLYKTQSKTSVGAGFVAILTMLAYSYWRVNVVPTFVTILFVCAVAIAGLAIADITFEDIGVFLFKDLTFTGRTYLWSHLINVIEENPILGVGFGSFFHVSNSAPNSLIFAEGWSLQATSAHNSFIDIWMHLGIIGLVIGMLPMIFIFIWLGRMAKRDDRPDIKLAATFFLAIWYFMMFRGFMEVNFYRTAETLSIFTFLVFFLCLTWQPRHSEAAPNTDSMRA